MTDTFNSTDTTTSGVDTKASASKLLDKIKNVAHEIESLPRHILDKLEDLIKDHIEDDVDTATTTTKDSVMTDKTNTDATGTQKDVATTNKAASEVSDVMATVGTPANVALGTADLTAILVPPTKVIQQAGESDNPVDDTTETSVQIPRDMGTITSRPDDNLQTVQTTSVAQPSNTTATVDQDVKEDTVAAVEDSTDESHKTVLDDDSAHPTRGGSVATTVDTNDAPDSVKKGETADPRATSSATAATSTPAEDGIGDTENDAAVAPASTTVTNGTATPVVQSTTTK